MKVSQSKLQTKILKHPGVKEVWHEAENGWWMAFADGWINGEALTHAHREDSLKELYDSLKFLRPKRAGDPN